MAHYVGVQDKGILKSYNEQLVENEQKETDYTLQYAPEISNSIQQISDRDGQCYDVLLLNYHNSQKSLQGFGYLYVKCLTEKISNINDSPVKDSFNDLEYIYYQDELEKIQNAGSIRIDNIEDIKATLPKMYVKLRECGARAAGIYTIQGKNHPIGMIVLLYHHARNYPQMYYANVLSEPIQRLASILDYSETMKENENESRQEKWWDLF